jgi:hypothetical protein
MSQDPRERARWTLILSTLGLSLVGDSIAAMFGLGWMFASGLASLLIATFVVYAVAARDGAMARLMLFGLLVGFGELPADAFGVTTTQTLVYWPGGPFIWDTPLYMPPSWMLVIAQIGYIGAWLVPRIGAGKAALAMAVFGGVNIPAYEFLAKHAQFWEYHNTPLLFDATPPYVILAEAMLSLTLPLFAFWVMSSRPGRIVLLAAVQSAWIYVAGRIAYGLVG